MINCYRFDQGKWNRTWCYRSWYTQLKKPFWWRIAAARGQGVLIFCGKSDAITTVRFCLVQGHICFLEQGFTVVPLCITGDTETG